MFFPGKCVLRKEKRERKWRESSSDLLLFTGPDLSGTGHCLTAGSVLWFPLVSCLWCDVLLPTCQDDTVGQVHGRPVSPPFRRRPGQALEF